MSVGSQGFLSGMDSSVNTAVVQPFHVLTKFHCVRLIERSGRKLVTIAMRICRMTSSVTGWFFGVSQIWLGLRWGRVVGNAAIRGFV